MKCSIIWVFVVCQCTRLEVSGLQRHHMQRCGYALIQVDLFGSIEKHMGMLCFMSGAYHNDKIIYSHFLKICIKVRKRAKIRNRYNQAQHLTQDTNEKVTTSQLDITNESQEVNPFPAGDHKASTHRRA